MPALNVVALVSGGKDSLYSMLHCLANGHSIIALANLHPERLTTQDLDSFMYQTVGHNAIELIAEALEMPLYRQPISGSAVSQGKTYIPGEHSDEVESMYALLANVKAAHPEANAVSTGAILSDYQRTRVESAAIRLDLTPLSYLWQYPFLPPYDERQLLLDIAAVDQDSRIIKVASGSLDETMLWTNVAEQRTITRLVKSAERFGQVGDGSILGEGGEYETLTIDGPAPLWKARIDVDEKDLKTELGDGGTAALQVLNATVNPKQSNTRLSQQPRIPPLFDECFDAIRHQINIDSDLKQSFFKTPSIVSMTTLAAGRVTSGDFFQLANLTREGTTAQSQAQGIVDDIRLIHKLDTSSINHTTIILRSMNDFPSVNDIYGSLFAAPNPPSRVTIACGDALPKGVHIAMTLNCSTDRSREGLHVQSRSYWAPANIGPYSQAVSLGPSMTKEGNSPRLVHIAGQIPLVPASMEVHAPSDATPSELAVEQTLLSAQHLARIAQIQNVNLFLGGVLFVGRDAVSDPSIYIHAATQGWAKLHEAREAGSEESEDEDVDVWDIKHGIASLPSGATTSGTYRDTVQWDCVPPFFVAEVQTLPRNAPVEWCSTGWAEGGAAFSVEDTDGKGTRCRLRSSAQEHWLAEWCVVREDADWVGIAAAIEAGDGKGLCTIYTAGDVPEELRRRVAAAVVPCYRLWNSEGREVKAVLSCISAQW